MLNHTVCSASTSADNIARIWSIFLVNVKKTVRYSLPFECNSLDSVESFCSSPGLICACHVMSCRSVVGSLVGGRRRQGVRHVCLLWLWMRGTGKFQPLWSWAIVVRWCRVHAFILTYPGDVEFSSFVWKVSLTLLVAGSPAAASLGRCSHGSLLFVGSYRRWISLFTSITIACSSSTPPYSAGDIGQRGRGGGCQDGRACCTVTRLW